MVHRVVQKSVKIRIIHVLGTSGIHNYVDKTVVMFANIAYICDLVSMLCSLGVEGSEPGRMLLTEEWSR